MVEDKGTVDDTVSTSDTVIDFVMPSFKEISTDDFYDYESKIVDYEDLHEVNKGMNSARLALFKITEKINQCERYEKKVRTRYEREHRRAYMRANDKTESARRATADLECEELENQVIVYEQVKQELNRMSNAMRLELQTYQAISNNIRQQMKMD